MSNPMPSECTVAVNLPRVDEKPIRIGRREMIGELLFAVSISNILFLRVWVELLTFTPANTFFMGQPPQKAHYWAAVIGVSVLSLSLSFMTVIARRGRSKILARAVTTTQMGLVLLALNQLRLASSTMIPSLYPFLRQPVLGKIGWAGVLFAGAAAASMVIGAFYVLRNRAVSIVKLGVLVLWPLAPIVVGQATWRAIHAPALIPEQRSKTDLAERVQGSTRAATRMVWVLFDEWDYRLTFEEKPRDLVLPHLNEIAAEAMVARNSFPPGPDTIVSIPSLLTGLVITDLSARNSCEAEVAVQGTNGRQELEKMDSIFSDLKSRKKTVATVGWYLPYCRLWGHAMDYCVWRETDSERVMRADGVGQSTSDAFRNMVETGVLSPWGISLGAERASRTFNELMSTSLAVVGDSRYDLVFLHLPVPHAPFYYDRHTGGYRRGNNYTSGYFDHLALLDESLGRIKAVLRESGNWDRTALLISSDHGYRNSRAFDGKRDSRVPFLLRVPGITTGRVVIQEPFSTVVTRRLVADLLEGRVRTEESIRRLLFARANNEPTFSAELPAPTNYHLANRTSKAVYTTK